MIGITPQDALASANRKVREGDFDQARELLLDACFTLRLQGSSSRAYALGAALQRLGERREQWEAMSRIPPVCDRGFEDWRGQSLAIKNILVEKRVGDIGADIRMARLTELAARRGRRCLALVDTRLVALFRRSFPSAEFQALDNHEPLRGFDYSAGYEMLGRFLTPTKESIYRQFVPLVADAREADRLRRFYRHQAQGKPVIGLSWHSQSRANKDMADLEAWAAMIAQVDAQFVSINYGDRSEDIEKLGRLTGKAVLADPVDQLASIDDLASQIEAVDQVISISNSVAHLAGGLGKDIRLVLTAFTGMTWPVNSNQSPWYPTCRIYRREDTWVDVFRSIAFDLADEFDRIGKSQAWND
jgi:hypothetical protein